MNILKLLIFFLIIIFPSISQSANFYVDCSAAPGGNGSLATPWDAVADVNAASFSAGDNVYLKRGCTFREQLTVPSSGSAGSPITFGAYGSGEKPIISGADLVTTWTVYTPSAAYFNDNFETGNSEDGNPTGWSVTETNGTLNVKGAAAKNGTYGIRALASSTNPTVSANIDYGDPRAQINIGFWFRATGASGSDGWGFALKAYDVASGNQCIDAFWNFSNVNGWRFEVKGRQDAASAWSSAATTSRFADGTWVWVEIAWKAAAAGAGYIKVRINGEAFSTVALTNDGTFNQIDQVKVGFFGGSGAAWINGAYLDYDDFMVDDNDASAYPAATNAWSATLATAPVNVYESTSTLLTTRASVGDTVSNASSWYHTGTTLYVHTSGSVDPNGLTIEATQRDYCAYGTGKDYITVQDLNCRHADTIGIYALDGDGWTINGNNVDYYYTFGILSKGDAANTDKNTGTIISNNTIGRQDHANTNVSGAKGGIGCQGCDDPQVFSNYVSGADSSGIVVEDTTPDAGGGLVSQDGDIYSNEITACQHNINVVNAAGFKIFKNYIHNSKGTGIGVNWGANNAEIYYNVIHDIAVSDQGNHYNGIDLYSATGGQIYNNTIKNVHGVNITLEENSTGATVKNNILDSTGNTIATPYPIYITANSQASLTLSNNIYYDGNTATDKLGLWGATGYTVAELADWNTATSDSNSLTSDPKLRSSTDFHLLGNSPAINAGADVSLTTDFAGLPIIGLPDIGAYEYRGGGNIMKWFLRR